MEAEVADTGDLLKTPLHEFHLTHGARMVPFAGYTMPVQYADGVLKEHVHTRSLAGLFDVSHMGQAVLQGPSHSAVAAAMEALTPGDLVGLGAGRMRYTLLLKDDGGIVDDLIVTRPADPADNGQLLIVWNASRKAVDADYVRERLPDGITLSDVPDRALLALQGPKAAQSLSAHCPDVLDLKFMTARPAQVAGVDCHVSRAGYTGEDGFEISVPAADAKALAEALIADDAVRSIGLGARDSLRLEAGLCLYGNDIDETTTPVEAGLTFAISKARRIGGVRAGGFPGAERILSQLANGVDKVRVGLIGEGRAPIRAGTDLFADEDAQASIGSVTSGSFGPSVEKPVAMAYVPPEQAVVGTRVFADVRGKRLPAIVSAMPFVQPNYVRG
ncbi:MAG: glycine cleavage system aminomethyltransferase GcvT [Pseudomonadota bacterium]